jgi:hydroxymethylpyrimidine pyrophosphatase-like HAD family hydrolase
MKFVVLALDYDGTIADHDTLHPDVRPALNEARDRGIVVVLVTGRTLNDLQRVAGPLTFLDAVVAENGAVLHFPANGRTITLAEAPPPEFVQDLRQQGILPTLGSCVVETDAEYAPAILASIRARQLPLALIFNRSRLMVLPQAVSKASGLHAALRTLRLSEHNTVAIGDAENDHALLQSCEVGAAVRWGSPALIQTADTVVEGDGPGAVAAYIRAMAGELRLPARQSDRHRLQLGQRANGDPVTLGVHGRNLLIVGDSRSGKSWLAGLVCEQLVLQRYSICVIDPEGDHEMLESLPGVVMLGGESAPPPLREVVLALRHPDLSVVLDLSRVGPTEKRTYVSTLLPQIAALRRRTGLPHRIVIDEAHQFLHGSNAPRLLDLDLNGYTLITYRLSQIHPEIRERCPAIVVTRLADGLELRLLEELCGWAAGGDVMRSTLCDLATEEAALILQTEEARGAVRVFRIAPRLTPHVRHRNKYADVAVPDHLAFIFTNDGGMPNGQSARTLTEFAHAIQQCARPVLDGHLRRGDLSRWMNDVFGDQALASHLKAIERRYQLHLIADPGAVLARAISERYVVNTPLVDAQALSKSG